MTLAPPDKSCSTIHVPSATSPSHVLSRHLPASAPRAVRIAATTIDSFVGHEMSTYAAALAYRGLFAFFPFIIFVFALVNVLDAWRLFDVLLEWARTAPEGRVPTTIRQWLVFQSRDRAEGAVLSVGALAAVWAVASGTRVLRTALNTAGRMPEVQPAWKRVGLSFAVAPVLGTLLLLAVALFMITRRFLLNASRALELNEVTLLFWDWIRVPAAIGLVGLVLVALYRFAPSHRQPFRALLPGTVLASIVWTTASLIFSGAVSRVFQFGVTYGSFSAAIILLVYLYFAAAGLLFGAELNAVMAADNGVRDRDEPVTDGSNHRSDSVVGTSEGRARTSRGGTHHDDKNDSRPGNRHRHP